MEVTEEKINWMPNCEREEIKGGENFSSLKFKTISTINQGRKGGGDKDFWRDDNAFFYIKNSGVVHMVFLWCWYVNCWTRNIHRT